MAGISGANVNDRDITGSIDKIKSVLSNNDAVTRLEKFKVELKTAREETLTEINTHERERIALIRQQYADMRKSVNSVFRESIENVNRMIKDYQSQVDTLKTAIDVASGVFQTNGENGTSKPFAKGLLRDKLDCFTKMKVEIENMSYQLKKVQYDAGHFDQSQVVGVCKKHNLSCTGSEHCACVSCDIGGDGTPLGSANAEPPESDGREIEEVVLKLPLRIRHTFSVTPRGDIIYIDGNMVLVCSPGLLQSMRTEIKPPYWCTKWCPVFVYCSRDEVLVVNYNNKNDKGGVYLYDRDYRFVMMISCELPCEAAITHGGNVAVHYHNQLVMFDRNNTTTNNVQSGRVSDMTYNSISGDVILVTFQCGVEAYASNLKRRWVYEHRDGGRGRLVNPRGVAVDSNGRVLVTDRNSASVLVLSKDGAFIKLVHFKDPRFRRSCVISVDENDQLFILPETLGKTEIVRLENGLM